MFLLETIQFETVAQQNSNTTWLKQHREMLSKLLHLCILKEITSNLSSWDYILPNIFVRYVLIISSCENFDMKFT